MITPKQIDDMGWRMAEAYGAVTDQILINIARHFRRVASEGKMNGSFEWQAKKLAELGQVTAESAAIIQRMLGDADGALRALLEQTIIDALKEVETPLRNAASLGLLMGENAVIPQLTPNQMQAFKMYYQQSADKLNLVNTVMLESTQQAYAATVTDIGARIARTQGILNAATGEVVTGASSYDAAIKNGLAKMVANGLTGFIDHAGRHWSPEAYVAMDVRSTVANTARAAIWERNNDFGNDLYKVSWHNGARPLCYPWQSKVISRTDNVRDVSDLDGNTVHVYAQSETTYGQAAGLFGVNCKHLPLTFIPGLSTIDEPQQDEEENAKAYAISQDQRALERKLRYDKRDLEILKASGAPEEEIKAARARVRQSSADIDAFCDKNNVPRRRNRERAAINATFPPTDSYNPADFDTTQRDQMREFFAGDRGIPANPPTITKTVTPTPAANVASQATNSAQNAVQSTVPDSIESAIGVKKGNPMTIEEARKGANPKYAPRTGYSINCQRCVQTYELRRRGYNVEAKPKPRSNNLAWWGSEIFEDYGRSIISAKRAFTLRQTETQVKDELANAPDGARYAIYIAWRGYASAHVFIAEKENGVVHYLDPQNNTPDAENYFKDGRKDMFGFFRMDDKTITTDRTIIKAVVKKGK